MVRRGASTPFSAQLISPAALGGLAYVKTADTTRENNTSYFSDPDLVSDVLDVQSIYRFELFLLLSGDAAQDFRFRMDRTDLTDADLRFTGDLDGSPSSNNLTWQVNTTLTTNGAYPAQARYANYIGRLTTGDVAGRVWVGWGQGVAGAPADATTLHAGSFMLLRKLASLA